MKTKLHNFLESLGLTLEEVKVTSTLIENGNLTILEIARISGLNRTNVYRIVESLLKRGVVGQLVEQNTTIIKAPALNQIEDLVKIEEQKINSIKTYFPEVANLISQSKSLSQPGTEVLFYRGIEGIKQMVWNTLQAKDEVIGYTYSDLAEILGKDFMTKWKLEFSKRKLKFRDILNEDYLSNFKDLEFNPENFKTRIISKTKLLINYQTDIYNNTVAYYNWHKGEIFGVEIHNNEISHMQRQLFEIIWNISEEIKS